jgi:anti-sigma regulatory factor (Ser/Thr protein kinase)
MQNSSTWETSIPNRVGDLMQAIDELDHRLEQWRAAANTRYLARLTVEELGTNIIKYGYDDQDEHIIHLSAACEESVFRICLDDDGHEFNPCLTPEPDPDLDLEDRKPGGWGLSLVRRLSAGLEYERRGGRNVVTVLVSHVAAAES